MANNAATDSSQNDVWVLRIGVVRGNDLVEERLVTFGQSVSVGTKSSNLFHLPDLDIDGFSERFELFEFKNDRYHLHFTEQMLGKIQSGKDAVTLADLVSGGSLGPSRATEKKGLYQLPLSKLVKGKIELGEYSFLFQYQSTPAVVVQQKKVSNTSISEGLAEDDAIFLSFLGFFSVVAAGMIWWIAVQPRPELLDQEEVEELIAEYLDLDDIEPEEPIEEPTEDTDEVDENAPVDPNKKPVEDKPEEVEKPEPTDKPTQEEKQEVTKKATASANMSDEDRAAAEAAVSKSFLFQAIGTVGEGSGGVVTSAFGGEGAADVDLDKVLDGVTDGQMAVSDAQMTVKGQMDKSGKATTKVGVESAEGKGGKSVAGSGPKTVVPKSVAKVQKIETAMGECSDGINKTVRKYLSQVKTCHDISLKSNPSVAGRVEIEVMIEGGKVTSTSLVKNSTGDKKVGSCIEKKIVKWKFPSSCSDIAVLPFALSPKN